LVSDIGFSLAGIMSTDPTLNEFVNGMLVESGCVADDGSPDDDLREKMCTVFVECGFKLQAKLKFSQRVASSVTKLRDRLPVLATETPDLAAVCEVILQDYFPSKLSRPTP
jgi:hypothetical protein